MQLIIFKEVNLQSIFYNGRGEEGKRFFFLFPLPHSFKKKRLITGYKKVKFQYYGTSGIRWLPADSVDSS